MVKIRSTTAVRASNPNRRVTNPTSKTIRFLLLILLSVSHCVVGLEDDGSCPLLIMLPFSFSNEEGMVWLSQELGKAGYSLMAAAQLAMDHFNARDSSVVSELAHLKHKGCPVYFPDNSRIVDTDEDPVQSVADILEVEQMEYRPCAVVGPGSDAPLRAVASVTAGLGIPHVTYSSILPSIADPINYPTMMRNFVAPEDLAHTIVSYVKHRKYIGILHGSEPAESTLAQLTSQEAQDFGMTVHTELLAGLRQHEDHEGATSNTFMLSRTEMARRGLQAIKNRGFRTIILLLEPPEFVETLAKEADNLGMLTEEYVWIQHDLFFPRHYLKRLDWVEPQSPMDKLLYGSALLSILDGFDWRSEYEDKFLWSWRQQSADLVNRINAKHPLRDDKDIRSADYYEGQPDYFQTHDPAHLASFVYDSIIAVGLGACEVPLPETEPAEDTTATVPQPPSFSPTEIKAPINPSPLPTSPPKTNAPINNPTLSPSFPPTTAQIKNTPVNPSPLTSSPTRSPGNKGNLFGGKRRTMAKTEDSIDGEIEGRRSLSSEQLNSVWHLSKTRQIQFQGASGERFALGHASRSRVPSGIMFGAYNILHATATPESNENIARYNPVLLSISNKTGWVKTGGSFVYSGGSSREPTLLREIGEMNYLSPGVRATGLTIASFSIVLCVVASAFVFLFRKKRVMVAAQPPFLHLLCLGSLLSSISAITMSFDESYGWSKSQLDKACILTPWLFFSGYTLVYAALLSKLVRINGVLQFRRTMVSAQRILLPIAVLLVCVWVLLMLWTTIDPCQWQRHLVKEDPAESCGSCNCDHFLAFFIPLVLLIFVTTSATAFLAWKTNGAPEDFSEWRWITIAILTQFQIWLVGLPVLLVLEHESVDAIYLGKVLIVTLFSMTSVGLVIGPKVPTTLGRSNQNDHNVGAHHKKRVRITGFGASNSLSQISLGSNLSHEEHYPHHAFISESDTPSEAIQHFVEEAEHFPPHDY